MRYSYLGRKHPRNNRRHDRECVGHSKGWRGSIDPGSKMWSKRRDCKGEQQRPSGLTAFRHSAWQWAEGVLATAATKTLTQTTTQTAVWTATWTQTQANTHSSQKVIDSPTPDPESDGGHQYSPCPEVWIWPGKEISYFRRKWGCTHATHDGPGDCVRDQQIAFPPECSGPHCDRAAKSKKKGTITAITHQNSTATMALAYRDVIINAAHRVNKGVINVEENESWETLIVHAVPLVRYISKDRKGLWVARQRALVCTAAHNAAFMGAGAVQPWVVAACWFAAALGL